MDIQPGTKVEIEIRKVPRAAAAAKTLTRICAKDPQVAKARRIRKRNRPSVRTKQRGGRIWKHRMRSKLPVTLDPGKTYTVRATLDVVRDLASVARYVEVRAVS